MKLEDIDRKVLGSKPRTKTGISYDLDQGGLRIADKILHPVNSTGAWILRQLEGNTSVEEILANAKERFPDVNDEVLTRDIVDFIYNLYQWGYIEKVDLPEPSGYYSPAVSITDTPLMAAKSGCGMCKESYV